MATAVVETRKTVADSMALGEGPPFAELINGEIVMAPSRFRNHQQVALKLAVLIQNYLDAKPGGELNGRRTEHRSFRHPPRRARRALPRPFLFCAGKPPPPFRPGRGRPARACNRGNSTIATAVLPGLELPLEKVFRQ